MTSILSHFTTQMPCKAAVSNMVYFPTSHGFSFGALCCLLCLENVFDDIFGRAAASRTILISYSSFCIKHESFIEISIDAFYCSSITSLSQILRINCIRKCRFLPVFIVHTSYLAICWKILKYQLVVSDGPKTKPALS